MTTHPAFPLQSGACIFGCEGLTLSQEERAFFKRVQPWAFILFARNIDNAEQIRSLCAELRACVGWQAPILIDQEGGRVARLTPPLARIWTPTLDLFEAMDLTSATRAMWIRARLIASELMELGIDSNCTPLADLAQDDTHPVLLNRCYGRTVERVVPLARANAQGCLEGGVLPVLKHIPGHGRATADSHLELPRVSATLQDLENTDFSAFKGLTDVPLGMTAHVVYDALDADNCGTVSAQVQQYIRREIGFDGLLMTDDLSMKALGGTMAQRTVASLEAGCDIILHCNGDMSEMIEISEAAGALKGDAIRRAQAAHMARREPSQIDQAALMAEFEALTGGI